MTRDQVMSKHIKRLLPPGEGPISYPLEFTTIKASPEAVTIYSHTFENKELSNGWVTVSPEN